MLSDFAGADKVYIACGFTDLRRGIDGFILLYKRLEQGTYQWPRSEQEVREPTPQQYRWLMEGLSTDQGKSKGKLRRPGTGVLYASF